MSARPITLDEVTMKGDKHKVPYSPWGYVIDKDASVYALTEKWTHGIVVALLYPQVAEKAGYEHPQREEGDLDVFRYQSFEHDCAHDLPVIRIALSMATGSTIVSTGALAPSEEQIQALVATLAAMGLKGKDTLTGEDGDPTVAEFVEELRLRLQAEGGL
jgi:hypothetical protein